MYPMNYMILKIGGTGARLDPLNQIGRVGYMNYMILKIGGTGARLDPLNQIGRVGYGTPSSSPHISG